MTVIAWAIFWIVATLFTLLSAAYLYSRHVFSYFQRRGIPYEIPIFPFGSLGPVVMLQKSYFVLLSELYKTHKGKKFVGYFQFFQKSVLIIDRELIKNVLVKNFEYFNGKNMHYNKDIEPLSAHLLALDGDEWKFLRTRLSPAFTSGKLKDMFETITDVATQFNEYVVRLLSDSDVIEAKGVFIRYGIAMVSSVAFGIDSDVFVNNSSSMYKVCQAILSPDLSGLFRNALLFFGRDIAKALNLRSIPVETHEFITKLVKDVVQYREENNHWRNDFLQILINMKEGKDDQRITMDELTAQAYIFLLGGFETTSNTMAFFLYEMAMNPEVQQRVLAEIDQHKEITYNDLGDLEYLDMVISETMRKHAPVGFLARVCTQDYKVPDTDYVIEKGTHVLVSGHGLHRDPELFPDPERFIPERFSKEKKSSIKPFSYMPFGNGPRQCIGMKFGQLVVKTGLAMVMRKYRVERTSRTPYPLQYEVRTVPPAAVGGIWVRLVPRTNPMSEGEALTDNYTGK